MSDCVFCRIVRGEIEARRAYEDDQLLAFHDVNPQAPTHLLIIPKRHIPSLREAEADDRSLLGAILLRARELAKEFGLADEGYRVVNNCGREGGQTVPHLHFHLLGGRPMGWPPG